VMPNTPPSRGWSLDEGFDNAALFFERIPSFFPHATLLCVEGVSMVPAADALYQAHQSSLENPFARNTLLPLPRRFACTFSVDLCEKLSILAQVHANQGLLDHLAVFDESTCLLLWHDAFANALEIDASVGEETVRTMAACFNVGFSRES